MASFTLTVGSITSTINATDINAMRVLNAFLRSTTRKESLATMTNQQKLDLVAQLIVSRLVSVAASTERQELESSIDTPIFS